MDKLEQISGFVETIFDAKRLDEWVVKDGKYACDLYRNGDVITKLVFDPATDRLSLYKLNGAIEFEAVVDGLKPYRIDDQTFRPLAGVVLRAEYLPEEKLIRVGFEGPKSQTGLKVTLPQLMGMIAQLQKVATFAREYLDE